MALADRDYYRQPPRREAFARVPLMSVTMWLITICCVIYIIDALSPKLPYPLRLPDGRQIDIIDLPMSRIQYAFHFSAYTVFGLHQYWRYITFQFLHAGIWHLLFNMLSLFLFGPLIEQYLGRKRFTAFYLIGGAAGGAMYLLLWQFGVLRNPPELGGRIALAITPLVGASAGIFGVLVAAARVAPDVEVVLFPIPIPVRLRTLAWLLIAIAIVTVLFGWTNAGGQAAHLGGAFMGYALISNPRVLNIFEPATWRRRTVGSA
jgi:membrane associated rhomboid family serine protease